MAIIKLTGEDDFLNDDDCNVEDKDDNDELGDDGEEDDDLAESGLDGGMNCLLYWSIVILP